MILDFPESTANDATKSDFDIPIDFQITRGRSTPPHPDKQCT
ncbi:hypothetical protein [Streptomyces sp. NPDC101776]